MAKHAYPRAHIRAHGKHHRPRTARPAVRTAVAAGGLTGTALVAGAVLAPVAHAASADDFARLRTCESGGNYQANTGNGFYGAYQFDLGTWHGLGYSGLPSDASPSTQDAAARELQSERGWQPWPACSRKLGLGSDVAGSSAVTVSSAAFVVHPAAGPMSEQDAGVYRSDVEQLQSDLRWLGYDIGVDGHFGPQTAATVREFQAAAQLTKDGIAGKQTLHAVRAAKTVLERGLARALERALAEQNRTV